jgi:RimJ/RimL family protein N-acetyltransferase
MNQSNKGEHKMASLDIFEHQPVLEDEQVLLRPIHQGVFANLLSFSLHQPEIWKYAIVSSSASGEENLKKYLDNALENQNSRKEFPFIVFDKQSNSYAGSTRFYDIQQTNLNTQLGYTWYGKEFQRTGLNRRCKLLLLDFAFEKWGLERVQFQADINNTRSIVAMKAIGCVEEGVLRNHLPLAGGGRRDTIVLSILRSEWFGGVKEMLRGKIYTT